MAGRRREYVAALALGAAGAVLVLLSVRQGWARVVTIPPKPLPETSVRVSGQSLVPVAGAVGVAALAGLAAVIATYRLARRLTGLLLVVFGVVIAVAVSMHVRAADVVAAARAAGGTVTGSATAGGGGAAGGQAPGGAAGVSVAGHVTMMGFGWRALVVVGAVMIVAAGLAVVWRGARWPAMSARYDQPTGESRSRRDTGGQGDPSGRRDPADSAGMWEALSAGIDPTDPRLPPG
jgi:uncharacterized membrane protein (TIGR02234 family)